MNRFSLSICYDGSAGLAPDPHADYSDARLCLRGENLHPPLRIHRHAGQVIAVLGNPIADDKREDHAVLAALGRSADIHEFAAELNGSFLIVLYDPAKGALSIVNDRFASLALYYGFCRGQFLAALSAKALSDARQQAGEAEVDRSAVFEFLYFRRLLGENTFDAGVRYLRSASILRLAPGDVPLIESYWRPDYGAAPPETRGLTDRLAEHLRHAVVLHTADRSRSALLLSGGLDSRAILAAMATPPLCITTALAENNEVAVARQVADAAGAPHRFIERPAALYDSVLDDAVFLSGGMQVYSEAQFLGYGPVLSETADIFLIGLGFDIFFGGLYLPKASATLLGRPALHHRLLPLSDDIAGDFIQGVKYRLRTSDPFAVVKASAKGQLRDSLRQAVEEILARGRALGASGYDLWEYMHLHNLSRHYSFPMMASVRTFADCRAPALENGLFDLAIRMTAQQKLDGTPYQRAIAKLNPAVMAVRNANTNVTAAHSLRRQTAIKTMKMLGHHFLGMNYPVSPGWRDRSWPSPKAMLAAHRRILRLVHALPRSERLASLQFLDMDAVARVVEAHERNEHDHAILLNLLLTIDRYLVGSSENEAMEGATQPSSLAGASHGPA